MTITFNNYFALFCFIFVLFELKHFWADFVLQNEYMMGKFNPGWDFILPLSAHCAVNAIGTFIILCGIGKANLWYLAIFDFVSHFVIDRIKASPRLLNRWKVDNKWFWRVLGLDQLLHQVVYIAIVYAIISKIT